MKHLTLVALLSLFSATTSMAQWCEQPNEEFCPGNQFTNGDFESLSGDPNTSLDRDIFLANGWGSIFANGPDPSNADLACAGTALCYSTTPQPNNGGVHAGMWIQNRPLGAPSTYREQMYNRLVNPIAANTGTYSFTCNIAADCEINPDNTVDIAVYGVYNPNNTLATNNYTDLYTPADNALWATGSGVQVVLLGTITTPQGLGNNWQTVSFTFNSSILPSTGITHIMITRSPVPSSIYRGKYINFDDFCMQLADPEPAEARGCCDETSSKQLLINGSFEQGNTGFTTGSYTYQGNIAPGSVTEGMYSVVTPDEAATISNCWNILDHTYCTDGQGHFMVVNGRTHNQQVAIVYQQKEIQVKEGDEYTFCMFYQHLPQCSFDVFDAKKLRIDISGADLIEADCDDDEEHCGWTKISYTVIPNSSSVDITVYLDESGIGDGNDVAFDDFSFKRKAVMPGNYCGFDISSSTVGGNITLTATALTNPLPAGFTVTWNVTEANCSNWTPVLGTSMTFPWNPYNTNFPGYCCVPGSATPGQFSTSKCYIVTRTVTNCCYKDCSYKYYLSAQPQAMMDGNRKPTQGNEQQFYISTDKENWLPLSTTSDVSANTNDLKVFPNPGDGKVNISATASLEGSHLTVYSADGKVVLEQNIQNATTSVDISKLANGIYSFNVSKKDGTTVTKTYIKQ